MKLLYIDAHHHYLNPTSALLPVLAASAAREMDCYGPGYSSDVDLEGGIRAYVDRNGPYDGVVLGMQVPIFVWDQEERLLNASRHVQRWTSFGSPPEKLIPFYRDVLKNVIKLPVRFRFISLLNFDYYVTTKRHTDVFDSLDAHLITPGAEFVPAVADLPDWAWQEKHFIRKKSLISSAWIEYMTAHPDRVLSLPHYVGDTEFSFRGLTERRHRISIPGVEYLMRKEGRQVLAKRGIRPARKLIFQFVRVADHLGIHVFSNYLMLKAYNLAYQGNLMDTRFVYTAREGFGIPLRKFFEIPAAGALMMCVSPHGFAELGFRDGENYLEVSPEALPDTIEGLERDPDRAQTIASAGGKLVFERHSLAARGRQFALCLEAINEGRYAGSTWNKGKFEVRDRIAAKAELHASGV
jgi:Glycosyl transferases group 1